MLRNRRLVWKQTVCLLTLLASLAFGSLAMAGKPTKPGDGGGGETTPVPAGTIYFAQSTADSWYYADMTMMADGSAKTELGISEQGQSWEPSHQLHEGQRWFLSVLDTGVMDEFGDVKQELFAFTSDGVPVQLTNNPGLWIHNVRWAKNDSFLSYVAYDGVTDEEDLHVVNIDWSSGSPMFGLHRKVLSTLVAIDDLKLNYLGAYDWSPAGNELVYNDIRDWDNQEIRVIQFFDDGTTQARLLGPGFNPTWSPASGRIAFTGTDGAIWLIGANGSNSLKITSATFDRTHWDAHWSPDGNYIACTERIRKQKGFQPATYTNDVLRVSVADGKFSNLTSDTAADCWSIGWR